MSSRVQLRAAVRWQTLPWPRRCRIPAAAGHRAPHVRAGPGATKPRHALRAQVGRPRRRPDLGCVVDSELLRHHLQYPATAARTIRHLPSACSGPVVRPDGRWHRTGAAPPFDWIAPDGCLCDAARPGWIVYKQGDGRTAIHDWGMEFTAAGVLLQSELLLISRDPTALAHYLPRLERSANFIESRRDATNNLLLAGPAGNLLAPSYAGWHRPDGSYGQAYLAGLSITYIAALDRLIELEKLAHKPAQVSLYTARRDLARQGLPLLTTEEGYFIRSLDPDGVKHGVFGAEQHGYFEASPNHDAIAFRVADDAQSDKIYRKIASLPGLRPYDFILPNYPSYDDMYQKPEGIWAYGTWVNGGHWSTCEARMVLAYYRLGQFDDARRAMLRLLTFAG